MKNKIDGKGLRLNAGKPRLDLIPADALLELAKVMSYGAQKYEERNWERGMKWSNVYASLLRHINARATGEIKDEESGLYHLALAAANILFLLTYEIRGMSSLDDLEPYTRK